MPLGVSYRPHRLLPPPLQSGRLASHAAWSPVAHSRRGCAAVGPKEEIGIGGFQTRQRGITEEENQAIMNHWQLVVICNNGDNDMPFLMLLDSLHMREPSRIENELKNFLKIACEGKEMRAVADELKVIDLHVPKLTADWFSREEYEKFREDLQRKRIHIDAQSASTSKDKIRDIKLTQQSSTSSSIASVGDAYEQVMGRDRTGRVHGIGTGPTPKSLWGSRSEQKLRQDNESLKEKIDALEERMKKIESRGNNEVMSFC
ncbi:hypothetical protein Taro_013995 [Colocasia esculenta]|uniref:Uncharacterized protein n=1 Tax=Colocasia esculenta TaxID=4460 RepID=A0A843UNT3_COLES|nr:hypothetical protein [Colocasia esculenta]